MIIWIRYNCEKEPLSARRDALSMRSARLKSAATVYRYGQYQAKTRTAPCFFPGVSFKDINLKLRISTTIYREYTTRLGSKANFDGIIPNRAHPRTF